MSQKQPIETTVEYLASQHESLPSASEETAAAEPVANSEMPQFAPPTVTGEIGRLGKYRIQKELGRGGMGAVYLAFDERLQRQIALKVMLPKFAANATAKDRFLREARAAAQISSDYVVNIHEADEIDGTPYIALQLLQGYPLDEYLKKKGSPSLPQIIRIGREIAIGLAAAHKLGLVHRDIKPGNVWLEAPNGRVKILDFGLAKPVQGNESAELTAMGALVGTPAYMAPEQAQGESLDGRADLFSLGCVLYRLCTGKLPFDRPTLMSILIAIATEEPKPVRELNPNVPEPLADLIHRLLAKNAADRPENALAVVKEFDGIIAPMQKPGEVIPHVIYAPMAVSVQQINPFADIDTLMDSETVEPQADGTKSPPRKFPAILVGSLLFALIAIVLAGVIVIKITNKDGTVTEVKVPKDSKIEVDGKTVTAGPKKPEVVPVATADRTAAAYVLSIGGTVRVNGENRDLRATAELPKEPFALTRVDLTNNTKVTDAGLAAFKDCKGLTVLYLCRTAVTDAGLAAFKDCKGLTYLDLDGTAVTDAGLVAFKDSKGLTVLYLNVTQVTDAGLAAFKDSKGLMHLHLHSTKVTDAGLAAFKDCKGLTQLNLGGTQVTDAGLAAFKDCKGLTHLDLQGTQVTDAGLAAFKDCKGLTVLDLQGTQVTDAGLAAFKDRKGLTHLNLNSTKVTDAGLAHFKDCKGLMHLYLSNTKVTDAGLAHFKDCKGLTVLDLQGTQVTDAGLAAFKDCKGLMYLGVRNTRVTAKGATDFHAAVPACKIDHDGGVIEPKVASDPERAAAAYVLSIGGAVRVNGEERELRAAAELPKERFGLTGVDLNENKKVTDAELVCFKNCKTLTTLYLSYAPQLSDAGLANFKECKGLQILALDYTKVTDKGLADFAGCPNLIFLGLHGTTVGDAGLVHFKNCRNLARVGLQSTLVSDTGLQHLKDCKMLSELYIRKTKVTAKGVASLKSALPECKIESDFGTYVPIVAPAQFVEAHGITLDAFKEWAAKLPKGYQPSWISLRSSGEVRFDAVATLVPNSREWKLIFVKSGMDEPYYALKSTHRLAGIADYKVGDKFDYFTLGIFDGQDGQEGVYWYGSSDFVGSKIVDGFKSERERNSVKERWLPYSLSAYNNGMGITYHLTSCWLPDAACEWHPELTADELATKVVEYRKKGWRPHIVSVHSNREDVKFLAVFTENKANATWEFTPNLSVADYEKQLAERKLKGQRPRCIGSHLNGETVSYTIVWDRMPAGK